MVSEEFETYMIIHGDENWQSTGIWGQPYQSFSIRPVSQKQE